jgi:hypothetical protein
MCGRALRCKGKIGEASRLAQCCVRPVGAVLMTAGLDEVRGSDPNQFFALECALTPWVVPIPGSTGLSSPLSTLARLVNLCSGDRLCRRDRVCGAADHQRPGDPRGLVGQCDGDHLRSLALEQPGCPDLARIVLPSEPQDGGRANYQEAPKVSVALLADPDLAFGPATAVAQLGRELATGPEQRRVGHTRGYRARRDRADAGDRRQPPARLAGPMPLEDFRLDLLDLPFDAA